MGISYQTPILQPEPAGESKRRLWQKQSGKTQFWRRPIRRVQCRHGRPRPCSF